MKKKIKFQDSIYNMILFGIKRTKEIYKCLCVLQISRRIHKNRLIELTSWKCGLCLGQGVEGTFIVL